MNRNQKIALGCGGAGCLGLIVVIAASSVGYYLYQRRSISANENYNFNANTNRASDTNSSDDSSTETSPADDTSTETSSSLSDDDKHKLFQAAGMTQDTQLITRVLKKIGLMRADGMVTPAHESFTKEHFSWAMKNVSFIQSVNTPEKARAYVEAHIDD